MPVLQRTAAGVWGPWVEIWRGRGGPCVCEAEAEKAKESDRAAGNPKPTELQTEPYLPQEGMPGWGWGGTQRPGTNTGGRKQGQGRGQSRVRGTGPGWDGMRWGRHEPQGGPAAVSAGAALPLPTQRRVRCWGPQSGQPRVL